MRSAPQTAPAYYSESAADFESVTLMRMRQAERDRLAREIEEAESREEAS
jgi:DnaJ family protein C protein 17